MLGRETRGSPTAWAAPPLIARLAPLSDLPPLWPDPMGEVRGIALEPLHASAPVIARRNPELGERLFLIDALRLGDARPRTRSEAAAREAQRRRCGRVSIELLELAAQVLEPVLDMRAWNAWAIAAYNLDTLAIRTT